MTRVRILGDHSRVHIGCAAVWSVLQDAIRLQNVEIVDNDNFDVLVVNGEGSMHHGRPAFRNKMAALEDAVSRGRRAFLVNTLWQENPNSYDHVLRALDGIVVREAKSRDDLAKRHDIIAHASIDLSYFARVEPQGSVLDFAGRIVVTDFLSPEYGNFVRATAGILAGLPYLDIKEGSWDRLVRSLRTSSLLVTGRHHAVYAASKAKVPFIAVKGNSHKIEGLFQSAAVVIPVLENMAEAAEAVRTWDGDVREFEKLWRWLDEQVIDDALPFNLVQSA